MKKHQDHSKILHACKFGGLADIPGGVTFQELIELKDDSGTWAINDVFRTRQLDKVKGGVTAEDLAASRDTYGVNALYDAVIWEVLDQIKGGVTIQQLIDTQDDDGYSAILLNTSWVKVVKEELIFDHLANVRGPDGRSVLHLLATNWLLDKISGGVTAKQLAGLKDNHGVSALHEALVTSGLSQIKGGVQSGLLSIAEYNFALESILDPDYYFVRQLYKNPSIDDMITETAWQLIESGADKNIVLMELRDEVIRAESADKMSSLQLERIRCLWKLADRCGCVIDNSLLSKIVTYFI